MQNSLAYYHPVHIPSLHLLLIHPIRKPFEMSFLISFSSPWGFHLKETLSIRLTCYTQMCQSGIVVNPSLINRILMTSTNMLLISLEKGGFSLVPINTTMLFFFVKNKEGTLYMYIDYRILHGKKKQCISHPMNSQYY